MSGGDSFKWRYRGICHKFGDDLQHDAQMISFDFVIRRVMDAQTLIPHLFQGMRPDFHKIARPGDIIIAGKNFGKGKAHIQAYIAMQALGLAVACESMPYNTYRALIGLGFTFMTGCAGIGTLVEDGDDIEIDFRSGFFANHTRGMEREFKPLPARALDIIRMGGTQGVLRDWWEKEQAAGGGA
jgi:3-isopropylmalate/(R)-2-methylmalate dehydratase small subunit